MDQKTTGIVSYLGPIGLLIAVLVNKEKTDYTSFHARQSLGIILIGFLPSILFFIPKIGVILGGILYLAAFVFFIIAIIGAFNEEKKLVPVLGEKFQEWFTFL